MIIIISLLILLQIWKLHLALFYIVLKTHSSVKLQYSKSNGLVVYKSQ